MVPSAVLLNQLWGRKYIDVAFFVQRNIEVLESGKYNNEGELKHGGSKYIKWFVVYKKINLQRQTSHTSIVYL